MVARSAERLRASGLRVSSLIKQADPKTCLLTEAEAWNTDAIFVGARGHRLVDRLLLGSVSASIAARAHCSVEIVRERATEPEQSA
jgi:nucleotide-binding universal stress UspA family protein